MGQPFTIHIDGIKEMNKALRAIDKTAPKNTRIALNSVADFVISKGRPTVPRRSGRAQRSWKAKSSRTESRVSYGGRTAPYMPWLDFGGRTGRKRSVQRPFIKEGRYLYPVVSRNRAAIAAFSEEALIGMARDAGLDVN